MPLLNLWDEMVRRMLRVEDERARIPDDADDIACTYCDTHVRRIGIG